MRCRSIAILGLPFLFRPAPNLAFLDAGGVRLMLPTPEGAVGGRAIVYFKVDDIDTAFRTMLDRGAMGEHEPRPRSPSYRATPCGWPSCAILMGT